MTTNRNELFPDLDYSLLDKQLNENWLEDKQTSNVNDELAQDEASGDDGSSDVVDYQDFLKNMHEQNKKDKPKSTDTKQQRIEKVRKQYEEKFIPLVSNTNKENTRNAQNDKEDEGYCTWCGKFRGLKPYTFPITNKNYLLCPSCLEQTVKNDTKEELTDDRDANIVTRLKAFASKLRNANRPNEAVRVEELI